MGSFHFYLSKCHFAGADLGRFPIRKLSGFSCIGCTVPAGLGFSRPCICVFPLPLRGHFAFSFFAYRLITFSFCTRGLVSFQSVATAWKVGRSVDGQISPIGAAGREAGGTIIIDQKLRQVTHRGRKVRIGRGNGGFQRDNWFHFRRFGLGCRMQGCLRRHGGR